MPKPAQPSQKPAGVFSRVTTKLNLSLLIKNSLGRNGVLKRLRVFEALRCGLLALIAKDTVAHGDFQKWMTGQIGKVSDLDAKERDQVTRTLRNYMRLASAFVRDLKKVKPEDIAKSKFLATPITEKAEQKFAAHCHVFTAAKQWIAGRALCEIYTAEGVLKADTDHGSHHAQKLSPDQLAQMEFDDLCTGVQQLAGTLASHVSAGTIDKLPAALRWQLVEAALPALEMIAKNTADLSPKQLDALKERLISINGIIRERLSLKIA